MLEILKVPMNLTNWVLVGSCSPNPAVQLHIRLKSEISVGFGFLKAAADELPKETVEQKESDDTAKSTLQHAAEGQIPMPETLDDMMMCLHNGVLVADMVRALDAHNITPL